MGAVAGQVLVQALRGHAWPTRSHLSLKDSGEVLSGDKVVAGLVRVLGGEDSSSVQRRKTWCGFDEKSGDKGAGKLLDVTEVRALPRLVSVPSGSHTWWRGGAVNVKVRQKVATLEGVPSMSLHTTVYVTRGNDPTSFVAYYLPPRKIDYGLAPFLPLPRRSFDLELELPCPQEGRATTYYHHCGDAGWSTARSFKATLACTS